MKNRVSTADYLLLLSFLGILVGIISGLSMVTLYVLINLPFSTEVISILSTIGIPSNYGRAIPPLLATITLIAFFSLTPKTTHSVGVVYVLDKLNFHRSDLPIKNAIVQFIGATISLLGGLSVGKEGPAVHIGATFGCKIASIEKLSIQNKEVLIACGAAGAIAAAFQTPLAGALFALEVVILGLHTTLILPVILSSVSALMISKWILGPIELFTFHKSTFMAIDISSLLPLSLLAVVISVLSYLFFQVQKHLWRFEDIDLRLRFLVIGTITAICAIFVPEALGIGYTPLNSLLTGQNLTNLIIIILITKLFLTAISAGLGAPGGVIGPLLVIGGFIGAQIALWLFPSANSELVSLFILLGMASMMATSLQAPLAGLVAVMELSNTSSIIVPAMFVIGVSCVITRSILRQDSIFLERLKNQGKTLDTLNQKRFSKKNK